ncbi:Alcohol dehydrogenase [Acidisarcina polymorpha]|uniref:Alcohol dehydrogenase n=1 Tax=Acidisarcina polymorpha TaxID=2211140 RepID=A0A2Z5FZ97_9BACT|nr:Alcohol dehydrogenase [Acidisarcina polymorpha]
MNSRNNALSSCIVSEGNIAVIGILDGFSSEIPIFQLLQKQAIIRGMVTGSERRSKDERMPRRKHDTSGDRRRLFL